MVNKKIFFFLAHTMKHDNPNTSMADPPLELSTISLGEGTSNFSGSQLEIDSIEVQPTTSIIKLTATSLPANAMITLISPQSQI